MCMYHDKYTYDDPQPDPIRFWSPGPSPALTVFPRGFFAGECPLHARTARRRRIRPLSAVALARSLDVEIYEGISENPCPVSVLAHDLSTGCMGSRGSSRHVLSDLRPMGRVNYPAGRLSPLWGPARVAVSGTSMEHPDSTCHPGLLIVDNCHPSKIIKNSGM